MAPTVIQLGNDSKLQLHEPPLNLEAKITAAGDPNHNWQPPQVLKKRDFQEQDPPRTVEEYYAQYDPWSGIGTGLICSSILMLIITPLSIRWIARQVKHQRDRRRNPEFYTIARNWDGCLETLLSCSSSLSPEMLATLQRYQQALIAAGEEKQPQQRKSARRHTTITTKATVQSNSLIAKPRDNVDKGGGHVTQNPSIKLDIEAEETGIGPPPLTKEIMASIMHDIQARTAILEKRKRSFSLPFIGSIGGGGVKAHKSATSKEALRNLGERPLLLYPNNVIDICITMPTPSATPSSSLPKISGGAPAETRPNNKTAATKRSRPMLRGYSADEANKTSLDYESVVRVHSLPYRTLSVKDKKGHNKLPSTSSSHGKHSLVRSLSYQLRLPSRHTAQSTPNHLQHASQRAQKWGSGHSTSSVSSNASTTLDKSSNYSVTSNTGADLDCLQEEMETCLSTTITTAAPPLLPNGNSLTGVGHNTIIDIPTSEMVTAIISDPNQFMETDL